MPDEMWELTRIVRAMLAHPEVGAGLAAPGADRRHRALEALGAGQLSAADVRRVLATVRGDPSDAARDAGT